MATWNAYHDAFRPLADAGRVELPTIPADCVHNAHMFYLKCRDLEERTALMRQRARSVKQARRSICAR